MTAAQTDHLTSPSPGRLPEALKQAAFAGLITAGLGFPIIALRAEPDISNRLALDTRWSWLLTAILLITVARFLSLMLDDWRARAIAMTGLLFAAFGIGTAGFAEKGAAALIAGTTATGLVMIGAGFFIENRPANPAAVNRPGLTARIAATPLGAVLSTWSAWIGIGALIAFPLVMLGWLGPAGSLKWINNYGVQIMIFVMLGWGLNIVVGLAGLLDLGYVAFYAVGAYSYALLATTFGLSFWICLPLAGILAAFTGILLGFPVLRLRGDYLALVTLAFGEIIFLVLLNWVDLTNGEAGISSIPRVTFFGTTFYDEPGGFSALFGLPYSPIYRTIFLFYLILFLALLTNFATLRLRRLPIGRAWEALREDEIACRSLGINTVNTKLTAFALGAMFGGFAGSFFAVRQGFVSPNSFTFIESATILSIVVLGGMGSQIGVALAAVVMIGGTELLRELDFLKQLFGNDFDPTQYRMLLFGLAMVVMMIFRPRGFISTRAPSIFLKKSKVVSSEFVGQGSG
jgi:branched-chain amino acid transport system permease protein